MPSVEGLVSRHQLMAYSMSVMCRAAMTPAGKEREDSSRPIACTRLVGACLSGQLLALAADAAVPGMTITSPGVVVVVSFRTPPPATLPVVVTR